MEFLRKEIEEKNLLIRILLIKENDVCPSLDKHHDANATDSSSDSMTSCSTRIEGAPIYPDIDTPLYGYEFSGSLLTLDEISSCTYLPSADGIDISINEKVKLDSQLKQSGR